MDDVMLKGLLDELAVMEKLAEGLLPDFLDKPRRGERLEPGSEDFKKNRAFGRGIGAAGLSGMISMPMAAAAGFGGLPARYAIPLGLIPPALAGPLAYLKHKRDLDKGVKTAMAFLKQDRQAKVKEIYIALKRDHPNMPAEMKARIAARKGKKSPKSRKPPETGGPAYKAPLNYVHKGGEKWKKAGWKDKAIMAGLGASLLGTGALTVRNLTSEAAKKDRERKRQLVGEAGRAGGPFGAGFKAK